MRVCSPNHWTTREFRVFVYFKKKKGKKSTVFAVFQFCCFMGILSRRKAKAFSSVISIRANGVNERPSALWPADLSIQDPVEELKAPRD